MNFMRHNKQENNYYEWRIRENAAFPGNIIVMSNGRVVPVIPQAPRHEGVPVCGFRYSEHILNFSAVYR
jgi:hypothetical protein